VFFLFQVLNVGSGALTLIDARRSSERRA